MVERLTGADLVGSAYTPPFSYYVGHENAHRVFAAEFVTTEDGTGLVHTAGAFGEVDKIVTDREGIEPVIPVGKDGKFIHPVDEYAGMHVFDANLAIIDHLRAATVVVEEGALRPSRNQARSWPERCCCAGRPTSTPTPTAGAAANP